MKKLFLPLLLVFIICFNACQQDAGNDISKIERPHDPWVFRSVLDEQARMITIALAKDVWVAYNTHTGSLYKAWKGIVNFEGAVYDHAHGPQPTSVGDAYIEGAKRNQWSLVKANKEVASKIHYKGHQFEGGEVKLLLQLENETSGQMSNFTISPRKASEEDSGKQFLEWVINAGNVEEGHSIRYHSEVSSLVIENQLIRPDNFQIRETTPYKYDDREFVKVNGHIDLEANNEARIMMQLVAPTYKDYNVDDGFDESETDLAAGALLIAKNDCRTCHNKTKKTVGPSYVQIAKNYPHSDENKLMLANKIKLGGTGVWGQQKMTPHPEISDADLSEMIDYIFSIAAYEGDDSRSESSNKIEADANINTDDLIPGSLVKVYNIPRSTTKIPSGYQNNKPMMAGIIPNFNNLSGGDFVELEDFFSIQANGVLYIEEEGEYGMRIWSDDGSRVTLHDEVVIDHDGMHGTSMREARLYLTKGYHPFVIDFFQGGGGKFLSWNYKKPGAEKWEVIPRTIITHDKNRHSEIGDLSLPMSIVTKIPGDRNLVDGVHPSFDLHQARPDDFQPKVGGLDFLSDGRAVVSTWDPVGGVYLVSGVDSGDPSSMEVKQIAFGLAEPLGVKVVDDKIYIMQKQEMTELIDHDGDDIIDEYKTICDDWGVTANFHEFGFGLEEKDGYLYANLATGILPGGAGMPNQHPDRGSTIKVKIENGSYERLANGLRTPNGVGIGVDGEIFVSDNQGDWLPSSKILHVTEGDWFGSRAVDFDGTADFKEKPPVVWLPQDEIGNSPSTPGIINVGPYQNQMIHGEVTHGGVKRVYVDKVNGKYQGALFRFTQGIEAGVNRLKWVGNEDLYLGGIGNPGNWQQTGKKWYGLQKMSYNGKTTFEMLSVKAMNEGLEIELTDALAIGEGQSIDDYEVKQWYYLPDENYGGPKIGEENLVINEVLISDDRKKVYLGIDGIKEGYVVYLRLKGRMISANNQSLWTTECWYTMNNVPQDRPKPAYQQAVALETNTLTDHEKEQGWVSLFDGETMNEWKGFNKDDIDSKWSVIDGEIHFNPQAEGNGGDIITKGEYENFELKLEWKIQNCGNSGIFFNSVEDEKYCCPWMTGPEMQVLDNSCHPDSKFKTHRAGDLYDLIETRFVTVNPAGEWNKVYIKSNNGDVEFWLNGYQVVEFTMHNDKWLDMIANSKFKEYPDWGLSKKGHIGLQDHGDRVWYRNLKVRDLDSNH